MTFLIKRTLAQVIQNIKEPTQVARVPLYKQVKPGLLTGTRSNIRQVKHLNLIKNAYKAY